jgi:hypothetical protein
MRHVVLCKQKFLRQSVPQQSPSTAPAANTPPAITTSAINTPHHNGRFCTQQAAANCNTIIPAAHLPAIMEKRLPVDLIILFRLEQNSIIGGNKNGFIKQRIIFTVPTVDLGQKFLLLFRSCFFRHILFPTFLFVQANLFFLLITFALC